VSDAELLSNSCKLSCESRLEPGAIASILAFVSKELRRLTRLELLANVITDASSVIRGCNEVSDGAPGLAGECGGKRIGVADKGRVGCDKEVAAVVCEVVLDGLFDVVFSKGECDDVLLVVAESECPNSWSTTVVSVSMVPVPMMGDVVPPPVRSEF
jgi:hypothetical protein